MGFGNGTKTHHAKRASGGVKTVFSNDMVRHVWAQQNQSFGRSGNGNLWFEGRTLYSYRTPIANFVEGNKGLVLLITTETYSVTTTQQMPGKNITDKPAFYVPHIGADGYGVEHTHAKNLDSFFKSFEASLAAMAKLRPDTIAEELASAEKGRSNYLRAVGKYEGGNAEGESYDLQAAYVRGLLTDKTRAQEYCDAFGIDMPGAWEAAEGRATEATRLGFERVEKILSDPKRQAKKEASRARAAKAGEAYAQKIIATRLEWMQRPDSDILEEAAESSSHHYGARVVRAPGIPISYRRGSPVKGLTGPQFDEAKRVLVAHESNAAISEREARLTHILNEKEREIERAKFEQWQAGVAGVFCPRSYQRDARGGAYLRIVGDKVQTSQGADVPLAHAVKAFKVAKAIRARCYFTEMSEADRKTVAWKRNGKTIRVGLFQVDEILVDGSFKAGCHFLAWEQIEAAAKQAGVFDEAGDESAVETTAH